MTAHAARSAVDDIMPVEEMRLRLKKYVRQKRHGVDFPNDISILDISNITGIRLAILFYLLKGEFGHHKNSFGPTRRIRLSRTLTKLESGLITKKNHRILYHETQTKNIPPLTRIAMTSSGPLIESRNTIRGPGQMPAFLRVFDPKGEKSLPMEFKCRF